MSAVTKFSSHWRLAGLNYLEMINIASTSLRTVMKEPARTEALSAAKFHYREFSYPNGVESAPGACLTAWFTAPWFGRGGVGAWQVCSTVAWYGECSDGWCVCGGVCCGGSVLQREGPEGGRGVSG